MIYCIDSISKIVVKDIQNSDFYDAFDELYNKGNDCDYCKNHYLCGEYGDAVGCRCYDGDIECYFVESK